jgi:hypothetical protein
VGANLSSGSEGVDRLSTVACDSRASLAAGVPFGPALQSWREKTGLKVINRGDT